MLQRMLQGLGGFIFPTCLFASVSITLHNATTHRGQPVQIPVHYYFKIHNTTPDPQTYFGIARLEVEGKHWSKQIKFRLESDKIKNGHLEGFLLSEAKKIGIFPINASIWIRRNGSKEELHSAAILSVNDS